MQFRLSKKSTALQEKHFCYAKASLWLSALLFCSAENACISCSRGTYVPTKEVTTRVSKRALPSFRHICIARNATAPWAAFAKGKSALVMPSDGQSPSCGLKSATPVASCVVADFKISIKFKFFDNLNCTVKMQLNH